MPKLTRDLTRLAALCGAAIICGAAATSSSATAAAMPKGALTGPEYRQLSIGMTALNRSVTGKTVNWGRARAACRSVGGATGLLRSQRASCLSSMAVLDALASFPREERRCTAPAGTTTGTTTAPATTTTTTTTTTTGTTTTPTDAAVTRLMICMSPHYRALAGYARRLDGRAIQARRAALARGFRGACLAALASTPPQLGKDKLFASSTTRLAADVGLLIKVTQGKAPAADFNQVQTDTDVRQFESSATAVLDQHGQPKLAVCPHR